MRKILNLKHKLRKSFSLLLFKFCGNPQKNLERINSIKNMYRGRRAFIVCNGPSLRSADLDKIALNGDISIASNKIDKIFVQTKWRPTLYTITDEIYQFSLLSTINRIPAKYKFLRKTSYIKTIKARGNCIFLDTDGDVKYLESPLLVSDISGKVPSIATVTYVMFEILLHLGISEIYIIGCDNSYAMEVTKDGKRISNNTQSYFAGSDNKDMQIAAQTWQMNIAYDYMRKYADLNCIKVFNATRGGHLEAFEKIDFDTLF